METFLEYETMCREKAPGHVFVESLAENDPRKVTEVVRGSRHKKQRLCDPFFRALSETHSAISLETCKAWYFQPSTPPAKFHPNRSKFPRFIGENDLPDRYNIRRSRDRIADTLPILYHGLELTNIDLLSTLPWLNINNLKYK